MPAVMLQKSDLLVSTFDGFGAQYNQNVHARRSRDVGVTPQNVRVMEDRMAQFAPHVVRVFFNADAFRDPDLMQSFDKTMKLAQRTGGAINVTLQGLGPKVLQAHPQVIPRFAAKLVQLVGPGGISKLKWVTLRNEPNDPNAPMDKQLYKRCYQELDRELKAAGVRSRLGFMGGDLLLNKQREWFSFLASQMSNLLDAYSIHVYWTYRQPGKIDTRLRGVREVRESLPPAIRRKPFYVMESGVRGIKTHGGVTEDPGFFESGDRIARTKINAFQRVWFALEAARQGFRGIVLWDAYFAKYDRNKLLHYSMLGGPDEDEAWPRRPAFRALRLLMRAVQPGWRVVAVRGAPASQRLVGFVDPADPGRLSVVGLDTAGGRSETASSVVRSYAIDGLPPNTTFQLCFWNKRGDGQNTFDDQARSDSRGVATVRAPVHSFFVLTRLNIS